MIAYSCPYKHSAANSTTIADYRMERIPADLGDIALGEYLLEALADTSRMGVPVGTLNFAFQKIMDDFPERLKRNYDWEAHDRITIWYRSGQDAKNFVVDGRAAGGNVPQKSLTPIDSTPEEFGSRIRGLMARLEQEHPREELTPLPKRKRKTAGATAATRPAAETGKTIRPR